VALSATWFTALHLNPGNALPILLLAAASDVLYLRSASLGPPLMLHAAWNSSQLLAVALLGKDAFV
jgi:membrane protease YdiL (CAAX protease family)